MEDQDDPAVRPERRGSRDERLGTDDVYALCRRVRAPPAGARMLRWLGERVDVPDDVDRIKMHYSGCTADCGQAMTADIGLQGMGADSARDDYDASENPPTTDAAFDVAPELVDAVGDDSRRASGETAL